MDRSSYIKKFCVLGVLSALAYVSLWFIRIPIIPAAPFLRCDVKDTIIMLGALLFGPVEGLCLVFVTAFLQAVFISEYGLIGFVMNLLSSAAFVLPAAVMYRRGRSSWRLLVGLICGCALMTATMLLWNYAIAPLYMGVSREVLKGMLLPVFLPFNLIKSGLNAVIIFILYHAILKRLPALFSKELP